jgi:DNA-directed RNA polymerase specialized sigma24 family protein
MFLVLDGLDHPEIGIRLGISVRAVEKHMQRARRLLSVPGS